VYCTEDRAVERAEEERRGCKDIVMFLRRGNRHEIPTTSVDVALIISFLEYFHYVYLGATNGWIQRHAPSMNTQGKSHSYGPAECPRSLSPCPAQCGYQYGYGMFSELNHKVVEIFKTFF
jgi:hypothetical protein